MSSVVNVTVYDPEDSHLIPMSLGPGIPGAAITFTYDEENDDGTDDPVDGLTLRVTSGGGAQSVEDVISLLLLAVEMLEAAQEEEEGYGPSSEG